MLGVLGKRVMRDKPPVEMERGILVPWLQAENRI